MSQTKQNQPQPSQPGADKREFDKTQPSRTDSRQAEGGQSGSRQAEGGQNRPSQQDADQRRVEKAPDRRGVGDTRDTDQPQGIDEAVAEGVNDTPKQQADGRPQTPDKANKAR